MRSLRPFSRWLIAALLISALVAAVACGDDDDSGGDADRTTAGTVTPLDTGYETPNPPTSEASAIVPPPAIGEPDIDTSDWQTFTYSTGQAAVQYPEDWHTAEDFIFSWDPAGATPLPAASVEEGGMRVDVQVTPIANFQNRPATAEDLAIPAGVGWHSDFSYAGAVTNTGNVLRIHQVGIPLGDQAVFVTGYLSEDDSDGEQEAIFAAIVWSLQVSNA